jgi:hypothetical protein
MLHIKLFAIFCFTTVIGSSADPLPEFQHVSTDTWIQGRILNGICFSASNTNPDELKDDNTEVLKNVQTYEDCQRRCESDLTCKKWTHIERSSLCNKFKTNVVDKQELDGCTSGAFKEPAIQEIEMAPTACSNNPCKNGGKCESLSEQQFTCKCAVSFEGPTCETRMQDQAPQDPCQNSRCTQEEICTPSSDFTTYSCGFPQKGVCFSGKDIDTEVSKNVKGWKDCADICAADLTCKKWTHIGRTNTCSKFKNTIVMKTSNIGCISGVSSTKHPTMPVKQPTYGEPEPVMDPCQMNTCVNGGRCKASPDFKSYTCECPDRFEGLNCERQEDPCKYQRCMNGGVCVATREQSYTCSCPHGFHGLLCEKTWNEGTWSEFSRCDKFCGGGMQYRTRAPHKITGETCSSGNMELRSCNTHKCIGNPVPVSCPLEGICYKTRPGQETKKNVTSWRQCSQMCSADWYCKKWTYKENIGTCDLFKTSIQEIPHYEESGCISGDQNVC